MKTILTLIIAMAGLVMAENKPEKNIELCATFMNGNSKNVAKSWGKPYLVDGRFGSWEIDVWDITITADEKKVTRIMVMKSSDKKPTPKLNLTSAAELLGFKKSAGWTHGQKAKKGIVWEYMFVTHADIGSHVVCFQPDSDGTVSMIMVQNNIP